YDTLVSDIRKQLKEFHTQQVDKQQLPMKKLAFEIAALLQVPNICQVPVLVGRVREIQQQIEKLQTAQREFRQEQAFQLHLYKAERSSKFHFMSPVPSPLRKTVFKEMENSAGYLVTTQNGISDVLVDYYSDLFAPPSTRPEDDDLSAFLGPLTKDKQLSDRAKVELAAPLRANEFYHAIRKSSSNSAPGPNALPFEVLKLAPHKWSLVLELYSGIAAQERPQVSGEKLQTHQLAQRGRQDLDKHFGLSAPAPYSEHYPLRPTRLYPSKQYPDEHPASRRHDAIHQAA
ncbi:hypothetical protein As57867_020253, partial [Aphanomyces stellatus]